MDTILLDMHHHKTYMYINFQQNRVSGSVNTVHTNLFKKNTCCINLQLAIIFFFKLTLSDIHHRKTYMYINFQPNQISTSVKTVHTNLFAKIANCIKMQLAIRILQNDALRTCTTP